MRERTPSVRVVDTRRVGSCSACRPSHQKKISTCRFFFTRSYPGVNFAARRAGMAGAYRRGHPCICQPGPCHQDPTTGQCTGFCDPAGPGGTCHLEGTECVCGPPPCGIDAATGQCGGPCPPGEICAVNAANQCGCGSPCQTVGQNVCGGGCPPGLVCHLQGQDCTCAQPPPCGFGAETAGACGGFCPAGTTCDVRPTAAGLSCTCQ